MSGAATLTSCNPPTIKEPVQSYIISQKFQLAEKGLRNLNYKDKKKYVGEWIGDQETVDILDVPDSICFPVAEWVKIKATLKKGSEYYYDFRNYN